MDIVPIEELKKGDIILVEGITYANQVCAVTVDRTTKDGLIIPLEMGGLDYAPEDPEQIVRLGTKKEEPVITLIAQKMHLALSKEWEKKIYK